ncbi:MAG TPA: site-2 protease family protein, partial [Gaiellaceae bacterium]|nr:site-2 protease family protein [Gaiellaceae bacterium]
MTDSFRLGRIRGIEIGFNWSLLVIAALITWSLAAAVFPSQNPGLDDGTYLAMALTAAVLFFVSILLHELGHAFQAQRDGMEIDGITLWLFGGVARFKGMFPSAGAEFRIALAGPAVSLVLGAAFVAVAVALDGPAAVEGVAAWLGYINLALLLFNLLPALPLDGGRVLRSVLWHTRGDFGWATRVAASIGRGFGFLFIVGGLALFIVHGAFSGAWLAFIGWFLLGAASAENRYLVVRQALQGLRVRDLMVREPVTVAPELSLARFVDETAWRHRFTTYPVVEDGRIVGLL